MRKTIFFVLASAGFAMAAVPADAALLAPLLGSSDTAAGPIQVADGCGYGGHRDRRARCRPDYDEGGALYAYRRYGRQFFRRNGYDAPYY